MFRISTACLVCLLGLAACKDEPSATSLGSVDQKSFEDFTGEPWPLTIEGGELFCMHREVNLGDNYLLWINASGEEYALNSTARFLLKDGEAKSWEDIWKRQPDGKKYLPIKPFTKYVGDNCKSG